jgi:hypothetical protein
MSDYQIVSRALDELAGWRYGEARMDAYAREHDVDPREALDRMQAEASPHTPAPATQAEMERIRAAIGRVQAECNPLQGGGLLMHEGFNQAVYQLLQVLDRENA